jgi:hypothetical protein
MPKKLENLVIRGVALVDRGANQHAKVLISKRVDTMTEAEAKAAQEKQTKDLADAQAALKAATDELTALKSAGAMTSDLETLKKQHSEAEKALQKERGELQEQVTKALKDAEDARAEVAKIKTQRRRENFIKRAHELTGLPGAPADDFAEILDAIDAGLHQVAPEKAEKFFNKFNQLLTSWNTVVGKSALFEKIGSGVSGPFRGAMAQMSFLAKEAQAKNPKLTYEQAFAKVMQDNPELYRKYETEKES